MSGILAVVGREAPPAFAVAERMSAALRPFGPHGAVLREAGRASLAVRWLRARDRERCAPLAASTDGAVLVAADARIDARPELRRALGADGHPAAEDAGDAELILAAYEAWGVECVRRLMGDFAFALWDARRQRLFCARDRFGVRPLFHALSLDGDLVVASGIDAVRAHGGVEARLDDAALGDFLIAGHPLEPDATAFSAIRTLPAAHTLVAEAGTVATRRYWVPELPAALHYRRAEEYAEHFRTVFGAAVEDRVAGGRTAVLMSGGRDSVSVAATARAVRPDERLTAFTTGYLRLMPDRDPHYAAMAARALGIPQRLIPIDDYLPFGAWLNPDFRTAEPVANPTLEVERAVGAAVSAQATVVLTGDAADAVLRETRSHLTHLLRAGHFLRAAGEAAHYARIHRRLPRPGLRTALRDGTGRAAPLPPAWIASDANARLDLGERWRAFYAAADPHDRLQSLRTPHWPHVLAARQPALIGAPVEVSCPFFDLRVIDFLLAVPPVQWYNDKGLLRMVLRDAVPGPFLRRQKDWLAEEPLAARIRGRHGWRPPFSIGKAASPWVERRLVPDWGGGEARAPLERAWLHLRPLALSLWLERL